MVDPDEPALRAWELRDGAYLETAAASGADRFEAIHPCPVAIVPNELVR